MPLRHLTWSSVSNVTDSLPQTGASGLNLAITNSTCIALYRVFSLPGTTEDTSGPLIRSRCLPIDSAAIDAIRYL